MRKDFLKRSSAKTFVLLTLLVLAGCSVTRQAASGPPWETFLYDGSRSNHSPSALTLPLSWVWSRAISPIKLFDVYPKQQFSAPVISNGVLYVGSTNEKFYAFDYKSGALLWKFKAEGPIEAPPTVNRDRVCFGSASGVLRCLETATGAELWSFQAKSEILSAPIIMDGLIYFYSSDDKLYALDAGSGEKLWSYTRGAFKMVSPRIFASPALSEGKLFQLFSDGWLVCLDSRSGRVVWKKKVVKSFDSAGNVRRTPLIHDGAVYMIDSERKVLAFGVEDGKPMGIYTMLKAVDILVADAGVLIFAGSDRVIAFDRAASAILWKREVEHGHISTIFAAGEYLFLLSNYKKTPLGIKFLASDKGYVQALSVKDGEPVWARKFDSTITANGSGAENAVAFFTDDGEVGVFASR